MLTGIISLNVGQERSFGEFSLAAQNASIYTARIIPLGRSLDKIKAGLLSGVLQGNPKGTSVLGTQSVVRRCLFPDGSG